MKSHRNLKITILTILGKITFYRSTLIPETPQSKELLCRMYGRKSSAPLDSYLGIAGLPFKITPSAMLKIAYWAQNQGSYQRAEEAIAEAMHIFVNDDTVRKVTNYVGAMVFQNDCKRADEAYTKLGSGGLEYPQDKEGVIYIEADGAALNTRHKDEFGSTWRENKLGEVFTTDDIYYWTNAKGKQQHRLLRKEYVSLVGPVSEFKKHLLACAIRKGYGRYKEAVILGDGAPWIRNMAEELFPDAQQILDFYHLCENVHTCAKYLFGMEESKYKPWAHDACDYLRKSQHQLVLRDIGAYKDKAPSGCPVNLYAYIMNNINSIDYVAYEEKGYFIGSGAIESGNKTILQDRLKRAGMRWNVPTAQAMLSLKTKAESDLWYADVEQPFLSQCFARSSRL